VPHGREDRPAEPLSGVDELHAIVQDLSALSGTARTWRGERSRYLNDPRYLWLHQRLGTAHAAIDAALVEATRPYREAEERRRREAGEKRRER
jgi:hypothetical protein